jgi:2-amino-4-hydroxy-6-hydroxymethyldihydropteridine diphosphokinase
MARSLVGLGSNLGPRQELLQQAADRLAREPGVRLLALSRFLETRPVGGPAGQPMFLNAAAVLETRLAPQGLLEVLHRIQHELGRQPAERWAARSIDLDLLLYDDQVIATEQLVVPHPRMAWRRFVLQPAAEVAPNWIHPPTGWSIARLLEHLDTARPYVAVAGAIAAGKTQLVRALTASTGAQPLLEAVDAGRLTRFYRNPAGEAWATEIEFLLERARRLDASDPVWQPPRLVVSDFWFDQSMAFAQVWLSPDDRTEFRRRWAETRQAVVRPKLIVLLEAPAGVLRQRIVDRARPYEQAIAAERLQQLTESLAAAAGWPDQGPVLRLPSAEPAAMLAEVLAAIEAMR